MKKWIVLMIFLTYLISFSEVRQLVKIPLLIEHYISHKTENQKISVVEFFKMHYFDNQKNDKDYDEDMKLPFKSIDFSNVTFVLNIPPEKPTFTIQYPLIYVDISSNFSYSEKFYPSIIQQIWEPPKI